MKKDYESLDDMIHDAKKRAMDLLQRQDRTESNLTEKLTAEGFPQSIVSIAIDYVKSYHYIDDIRYAENYIRFHMQDRSKQRLTYDLLKKGVSRDDIDEALSSTYEVSEREQIIELLAKKHYNIETADAKERNRIIGFLQRRGYQYEDILSCINS